MSIWFTLNIIFCGGTWKLWGEGYEPQPPRSYTHTLLPHHEKYHPLQRDKNQQLTTNHSWYNCTLLNNKIRVLMHAFGYHFFNFLINKFTNCSAIHDSFTNENFYLFEIFFQIFPKMFWGVSASPLISLHISKEESAGQYRLQHWEHIRNFHNPPSTDPVIHLKTGYPTPAVWAPFHKMWNWFQYEIIDISYWHPGWWLVVSRLLLFRCWFHVLWNGALENRESRGS